jgi:hypothetical protein
MSPEERASKICYNHGFRRDVGQAIREAVSDATKINTKALRANQALHNHPATCRRCDEMGLCDAGVSIQRNAKRLTALALSAYAQEQADSRE